MIMSVMLMWQNKVVFFEPWILFETCLNSVGCCDCLYEADMLQKSFNAILGGSMDIMIFQERFSCNIKGWKP
jgi:hypothetical protein